MLYYKYGNQRKENQMELNESNNWGDKMIRGGRPKCPKCGAPCEDDGDRYYADNCWECGWSTLHDKERQRINYENIKKRGDR